MRYFVGVERRALLLVLTATVFSLGLGFALKLPCVLDPAAPRSGLEQLCYTDISTLYQARRLGSTGIRRPLPAVEYPVAQALVMGLPARIAGSATTFFFITALGLSLCALATAIVLYKLIARRALYFALAPTLMAYAFLNWDLLAVAVSTVAFLAFVGRRDRLAGALLGLGAAVKIYPALIVLPLVLERTQQHERAGALRIAAYAAVAWVALNLPFAVTDPDRWSFVYRFSTMRPVHWESLWFLVCHDTSWRSPCGLTDVVNLLALVAFAILAIVVTVWTLRRGEAGSTLIFPFLAILLLTNKIYSPQYSLWLIPWFALAFPKPRFFCAFVLSDLLAFAIEFLWIEGRATADGFPVVGLELSVIFRAVALSAALIAYLRSEKVLPLPAPRSIPAASS